MTKIIVHEIEQITPGARHYWLRTNVGRIRKPIGSLDLEQYDFSQIEKNQVVLIESRLLHWGNWLCRCITAGIGYPAQSTLVTALQGSPATATRPIPDDHDAEQVDIIVRKIGTESPKQEQILRKHYTRDNGDTADEVAASMEMPRRNYFYYLNLGRKKVELALKRA
jgi:hypothetical protein